MRMSTCRSWWEISLDRLMKRNSVAHDYFQAIVLVVVLQGKLFQRFIFLLASTVPKSHPESVNRHNACDFFPSPSVRETLVYIAKTKHTASFPIRWHRSLIAVNSNLSIQPLAQFPNFFQT